jgi:hypothetical protein
MCTHVKQRNDGRWPAVWFRPFSNLCYSFSIFLIGNIRNIARMFAPVCLIFCVLLGFVDSSRSGKVTFDTNVKMRNIN